MSNLLIFLLTAYGLTTAIVQSKIAEPFREFFKYRSEFIYKLLNCMMCTGFWVSIGISFLIPQTTCNILDGFLGLGGVWLLYMLQLFLEEKSNFKG